MSDPVTNVEIEDVLSSIRRLVTDTDRIDAVKPAPDADAQAEMPHFVLTPALRVNNESAAALASESTDQDDEETEAETVTSTLLLGPDSVVEARASLEATIAELEAAVTDQPDEWELDGSEVKSEVTWESAGFVRHSAEAATEEAPSSEPTVSVDDASDAPEADDDVDSAPIFTFQRRVDPVAEEHGDELATDDLDDAVDPDGALEAYLSGQPDIDEKLLRSLIQQVVREELQGHLGERITRNVRKLVRREIHRVLTRQDFD